MKKSRIVALVAAFSLTQAVSTDTHAMMRAFGSLRSRLTTITAQTGRNLKRWNQNSKKLIVPASESNAKVVTLLYGSVGVFACILGTSKFYDSSTNPIKTWEVMWGNQLLQQVPHYKYVGVPLYKKLGGKELPLVSVPATFVAMDFMFHHLPSNIINSIIHRRALRLCRLDPRTSTVVAAFAMPIAIHKEMKRRNRTKKNSPIQNKRSYTRKFIDMISSFWKK